MDTSRATIEKLDDSLLKRLDPEGKLNISLCLQCGRCSSGCTMRSETDILPHQLNRMAVLGMTEELVNSKSIWTCASCQTCVSRCPMGVNTPALVDKLREMTQTAPSQDTDRVRVFNETMLDSMRTFGRVYEMGLMGVFKLKTRDFFTDLNKFPAMLRKRKIKLLPKRSRSAAEVASIFARTRRARRNK